MSNPVFIQRRDISVHGDSTTLNSQALAEAVESEPDAVLALFEEQLVPVKLSEISVDPAGKVVIADAKLAAVVTERFTSEPIVVEEESNGICGLRCGNS